MIWKPHVTVAVVVERQGRFLLVEEQTEDGIRINQPAGHLEADESIVEGAVREAFEETAHEVVPEALVGIYRWAKPDSDIVFLRFAFAARSIAHHPDHPLDRGILRAVWLTPDELRAEHTRHRSPLVMQCVEDHLAGKRYPLDLLVHYA